MDRNSAWHALVDMNLVGVGEPWKPILRDMIRVLLTKFPEHEQTRLIPREEITKIITLRRMIQLPLEVRRGDPARTWQSWCDVLWVGLPKATYSLWDDILKHLFMSEAIGDQALAEYLQSYNVAVEPHIPQ